jgi:hypothetical protein
LKEKQYSEDLTYLYLMGDNRCDPNASHAFLIRHIVMNFIEKIGEFYVFRFDFDPGHPLYQNNWFMDGELHYNIKRVKQLLIFLDATYPHVHRFEFDKLKGKIKYNIILLTKKAPMDVSDLIVLPQYKLIKDQK